jgi:hypothetical protein
MDMEQWARVRRKIQIEKRSKPSAVRKCPPSLYGLAGFLLASGRVVLDIRGQTVEGDKPSPAHLTSFLQ